MTFDENFPEFKDEDKLQLITTNPSQSRTGYILAHKSQIREEHSVFAISVVRNDLVEQHCLSKQRVREAIEDLTRDAGEGDMVFVYELLKELNLD